jgi:hypothetical protein
VRPTVLQHLREQHRRTKTFMRDVRDEMEETRRYLKQTFEGFSLSKLHGGLEFKRRAIRHSSGGNASTVGEASQTIGKDPKNHIDGDDPMYLIQQISSLQQRRKEREQEKRNNRNGGNKKGTNASLGRNITTTRVALAKAGQLKATFQSRTLKELVAMEVVANFDSTTSIQKYGLKEGKRMSKPKQKSRGGKNGNEMKLHVTYLIAGSEDNQDIFTVSGTVAGQHMVDQHILSLEHLEHMRRTMTSMYKPPKSSTTYYVSELVQLLKSMHKRERVLNF